MLKASTTVCDMFCNMFCDLPGDTRLDSDQGLPVNFLSGPLDTQWYMFECMEHVFVSSSETPWLLAYC